jgi:hypothetical protein
MNNIDLLFPLVNMAKALESDLKKLTLFIKINVLIKLNRP